MKVSSAVSSTSVNNNNDVTASWATASFSVAVYAYSVFSLVSWWFFLVPNHFLPDAVAKVKLYSMDTATTVPSIWTASLQNMAAMCAFGFTHSIFARKSVKKWMALPMSVERSFFCLQGTFFLHLIQMTWVEASDAANVWDLTNFPQMTTVALALFWMGSAVLLSATFALDHFHMFGVSQGFGLDLNGMLGLTPPKSESGLATRWHYRIVAHPIMTGALMNLWATPIMTPCRLVLAMFLTSYIVGAVTRLEEPSIREDLGGAYDEYLKKTPRFFPAVPHMVSVQKSSLKET
ncbi:integral membrane protein [Seminavis robusta]|uniref:Nuclear envelope membrane protein n=1 Tax=Seminavis robusta TaxID=568900 RepID=A0A9N8DCY3_9STRA|nr:integral membrane protein [Seminavis robusta]|eukprot:Sro39_g024090.1 integral membrane protein (291) ;mRNA; r:58641-59513